jgi:hypothetical protein
MCFRERRENLRTGVKHHVRGQRAVSQPGRERLPFNKFHDQVVGPDVVECADVRVIQRGDRTRLAFETRVEPLVSDLDGDGAAQSRIHRTKHLAHAAFAELAFDAVWPEECPGRHHRGVRIVHQSRTGLDDRPVQKQILGMTGQQRFDFAAQFGLRSREQRRPLFGRSLLYRMEQRFDLTQSFRRHARRLAECTSSPASQTLANSQSRRTVRGEMSSTFAISSSVNPPN